jgi:hypothetical protein
MIRGSHLRATAKRWGYVSPSDNASRTATTTYAHYGKRGKQVTIACGTGERTMRIQIEN